MTKSAKRRQASKKAYRSSSSPARTPSVKSSSSKQSRSRSRTRSVRSTPRSRSNSRNRGDTISKKSTVVSQAVKKFNDFTADLKKATPLHGNSAGHPNAVHRKNYNNNPPEFDQKRERDGCVLLQPFYPSNLKVKAIRLKRRLTAHGRRNSRLYTTFLILGLLALGLGYAGYTVEQMIRYARGRVNMLTTYLKKRR